MGSNTHDDSITLVRSLLVGLLWTLGAMMLNYFFVWPAEKLAGSFYILISYALLSILAECIFWYFIETFMTESSLKNKEREPLLFGVLGVPAFIIFFPKLLSDKTNGWITSEDMSWEIFINLSLDNWWIAILTIIPSAVRLYKQYISTKTNRDKVAQVFEQANVKLFFAILGCLLLCILVGVFSTGKEQAYLYFLLVFLFFLPWDRLFKIAAKIYYDYWKLD